MQNNNQNIKSEVRKTKEAILNQNAKVIWFTGLSGAGKTTISVLLEQKLLKQGFICNVIDGDIIRHKLNKDLGFSENDRLENIRRIAEISKMFLETGVITINAFVSPTEKIRNVAKEIIGENDFLEIFINSSIEVCENRDVKGLYKKAREGKISDFTGITSPYENPKNPFLEVRTDILSIEQSVEIIIKNILPLIKKD
ncbi:MAG TPA: adenylyl-sulfate kinase [Bacteroidales bacterium]|nr:MAG: adenylyl-sulfate kinase [Bacteroidetes bacterium GWF2_33_38]OFY73950.1 MAG: adenylyl-sulfate kinase [Bacteroidetes bacterium RIFOXYA12_FULL_33_9]OFY90892.1 MAG: adenylyl-sulfate kinase [Bacteroidetes bacterium RIFOXYA2_FULL_33_7]HBF88362.1 adenylyl-sulfate kinase [Bacteroidales bacterium]